MIEKSIKSIIKNISPKNIIEFSEKQIELQERIAGSEESRKASELIKDYMKSLNLDDVWMEEFKVSLWKPKSTYLNIVDKSLGESINTSIISPNPYSHGACKAKIVHIPNSGLNELDWKEIDVEEKIALVEWPCRISVYNLKDIAIHAQKYGACGLIVYDCIFGNVVRKVVVAGNYSRIGEKAYTFRYNGSVEENLIPIPIITIPRELGFNILRKISTGSNIYAELCIEADIVHETIDRNVVGVIYGRKDNEWITIGAHYDCWFQGASDNTVSVSVLMELARVYSSIKLPTTERSLVFVAYGAEESGGLNFEPWYWIRGSRAFVEKHRDKLMFNYNLDVVVGPFEPYKILINTLGAETYEYFSKLLAKYDILKKYQVNITMFKNQFLMSGSDHYPYIIEGIPIASLHNGTLGPYYHTNKDILENLVTIINNHIRDLMIGVVTPLEYLLRSKILPLNYSRNAERMINIITDKVQVLNKYAAKTQIQVTKLNESLNKFKKLLEKVSKNKIFIENRVILKYLYEEYRVLSVMYMEKKLVTWENHNYLSFLPLDDLINLMRSYLLIDIGDVDEALKILKGISLYRIIPGIEKSLLAPQWIPEIYKTILESRSLAMSEFLKTFKNYIDNYVEEYNKFLNEKISYLNNVLHKLYTP